MAQSSELMEVRITASNTVRSKRPYTTYEIEVRSSSTMPWLLYKRYRDFDVLHQNLLKAIQKEGLQNKVKLGDLPPKRLVRSMAPEVVAKRQRQLEKYLVDVTKYPQLAAQADLQDFLSVPESLKSMLTRQNFHEPGKSDSGRNHRGSVSYSRDVPHEKRQIDLLLRELNSQKNRVKALANFEQWYFDTEQCPYIRQEYIKLLLVGADLPGLVHSCRRVSSKVAWRASISLLVRLLDIERNKHARMFQEIFFMLEPALYKEMYLHMHIKDATQEDGFKIVKLIKDRHPDLDPKIYVPDAEAWHQFKKWERIQNDLLQVHSKEPEEREKSRVPNWKEFDYKQISDLIINQFLGVTGGTGGDNEQKGAGNGAAGGGVYEMDDDSNDYKFMSDDAFSRELLNKFNNELSVMYKKDEQFDEWKLKISFVINHAPDDVFSFLMRGYVVNEDGTQEGWNRKMVDQKLIEKCDENNIVYEETYKSFNSPYKFRDFVVLRCFRKNFTATMSTDSSDSKDAAAKGVNKSAASSAAASSSGSSSSGKKGQRRHLMVFSSINNYDKISESKDKLRTIILPSGFEIKPYESDANRSYVSFRAHMTSESILLVSADLLGETDELFQSLARIENLVTIHKNKAKSRRK